MKNTTLKLEVKKLIADKKNIESITKGDVGSDIGCTSIEVAFKEPVSFGSYIYKTETDRDLDFEALVVLVDLEA